MALYHHDLAICPWCGAESGHRVDHLYGDKAWHEAGPWYCDKCRQPFRVKINAPGDVEVTRTGARGIISRSLALLKFDGKNGPVFFVMDHDRYREDTTEGDEQNQESQRYFFEEHSCPTNWLHECVAVIEDGDTDPHGFLDFVHAVDVPQDFDINDDEQWSALFPEAFRVIEGTASSAVRRIDLKR